MNDQSPPSPPVVLGLVETRRLLTQAAFDRWRKLFEDNDIKDIKADAPLFAHKRTSARNRNRQEQMVLRAFNARFGGVDPIHLGVEECNYEINKCIKELGGKPVSDRTIQRQIPKRRFVCKKRG